MGGLDANFNAKQVEGYAARIRGSFFLGPTGKLYPSYQLKVCCVIEYRVTHSISLFDIDFIFK
jgi:hypothetical protein